LFSFFGFPSHAILTVTANIHIRDLDEGIIIRGVQTLYKFVLCDEQPSDSSSGLLTSSESEQESSSEESSAITPALLGITVAIVLCAAIAAAVIVFFFMKRKRTVQRDSELTQLPTIKTMELYAIHPKSKEEEWDINFKDLEFEGELGRGSFGVV
jgi:hypothetical protein